EGRSSGTAAVGGVVGAMVGGGLGVVVGRAVGTAIDGIANGSFSEGVGQTNVYRANLGVLTVTDSEVIVIDSGSSYIMSERMNIRQVKAMIADKEAGRLNPRVSRAPRDSVKATLRHDGKVLQLTGIGSGAWQMEIANLPQQPDAHAFVRSIMKVP